VVVLWKKSHICYFSFFVDIFSIFIFFICNFYFDQTTCLNSLIFSDPSHRKYCQIGLLWSSSALLLFECLDQKQMMMLLILNRCGRRTPRNFLKSIFDVSWSHTLCVSCTPQSWCLKYLFYGGHAVHGPHRIVQDTFPLG
jgi:hypothetical protein